jgi:hypothetical protein
MGRGTSAPGPSRLACCAAAWKDWAGSPITFSGWRDESPTDDSVVGRVRLVGTPRFKTAEQITDDERPVLHGYRILAKWPVKDYRARVVLTAGSEGQQTVTWSGEFTERIPAPESCGGTISHDFSEASPSA